MRLILILFITFASVDLYAPLDKYRIPIQINTSELERFLLDMGKSESSCTWDTVNKIGAKGYWQFTDIALKDIGYIGTVDSFLLNKELQRLCMLKLINRNLNLLNKYVDYENLIGFRVRGVKITKSGLVAACHLAGAKSVYKYIMYGYNPKDKFKTSISDYVIKFKDYQI